MTWNVFYEMVAEGNITDEVKAMARKKVDSTKAVVEAKNTKRLEILNAVDMTKATAKEIAERLGGKYAVNSVSATLVVMAKDGLINKSDDSPRTYWK